MDIEKTTENYNTQLPDGWVQAKYETATHYLIGYLMAPKSEFRTRWENFNRKWSEAKGLEMRIKQKEIKYHYQGFSNPKMREAVERALQPGKSRASGTIDILRLDKILIEENLAPLASLDPRGFVAKTPGSKREAKYRQEGVPEEITDEVEGLKYIKKMGPPISETASTKARGNRDPRIKAQRCVSEWTRWLEMRALERFLEELAQEFGRETVELDRDEVFKIMRQR